MQGTIIWPIHLRCEFFIDAQHYSRVSPFGVRGHVTKKKRKKKWNKNRTSERKISWFLFFCSPLPSRSSRVLRFLPYIVCGITLIVYDRVLSISNVQLNFARVTFLSFAFFFAHFFPIFSLGLADDGRSIAKLNANTRASICPMPISKQYGKEMSAPWPIIIFEKVKQKQSSEPASRIFINVRAVMHAGKSEWDWEWHCVLCRHRCDWTFSNFFLSPYFDSFSDSNIRRC